MQSAQPANILIRSAFHAGILPDVGLALRLTLLNEDIGRLCRSCCEINI